MSDEDPRSPEEIRGAPLPPHNVDAEESLIGAMMMTSNAIEAALDAGVAARDFYRPSHGVVFDACVALYGNDEPVDSITVVDKLNKLGQMGKAGGEARVHDLSIATPAASNAGHYARIIREMAIHRALIAAGHTLTRLGYSLEGETGDLIEEAERAVFDLALTGRTSDFVPVSEPLQETFKRLEELASSGSSIVGVPSGFTDLDAITDGFEAGNLIVVAARPSMGKSAFALNICGHLAITKGLPVGLFTLEMSRHEVTQRLLSAEGSVQSGKIRSGKLNSDEWGNVTNSASLIHTAPLFIDDTGALTAMELRAKARRLKMRHPDLSMIVVDYLQLMASGTKMENRVQDIGITTRALKVLAGELRIPVIALSQLSRSVEQRHDKRPILSDLRESGAIEQDADMVMFIYRDEYYHPEDTDQHGIAEVSIAKHRNGPTGMVKLAFVKRYTRFNDLARGGAV